MGASEEHLPPPSHVVGPNSGSPEKTISSGERQRHCTQTFSLDLYQVSSDKYERTMGGESIQRLTSGFIALLHFH